MTLPHLIFWIVLSALLLAFGLLILLSACKAAGRNPLAGDAARRNRSHPAVVRPDGVPDSGVVSSQSFNSRGAASQLNPGQRPGAECDDRGQFTSADQSETNPYSAELGGSAGARNSLSSIGTGPATAQGPHPRVIEPGNSASGTAHADARKISSLSKSAMAPALTGRIIAVDSLLPKSTNCRTPNPLTSKPALAHLISIGGTIRRMA